MEEFKSVLLSASPCIAILILFGTMLYFDNKNRKENKL